MPIQTYPVAGMTSPHCVNAVSREVSKLAGVSEVVVDLVPGGTSTMMVVSLQPLEGADVAAALNEAGHYRLAT